MCQFFSFCTEPEEHGGKRYYSDWKYRVNHILEDNDSHSLICKRFGLDEDRCNKYEYNPLTKVFHVDKINSSVDDRIQAENWANRLDFRRVIEPLIIKPIINPLDLPPVAVVTPEIVELLKVWASVRASVEASVRASVEASVWASVWASVGDSVWDSVSDSVMASVKASVGASVRASVGDSVWDSVWDSVRGLVIKASVGDFVWVYISSFFGLKYEYDFAPANRLFEMGIIPIFYGRTWKLHTGADAHVIYEWTPDEK